MKIAADSSHRSIFQSALVFFAATIGVYLICDIDIVRSICSMLARGAVLSAIIIMVFLTPLLVVCEGFINKTSYKWREFSHPTEFTPPMIENMEKKEEKEKKKLDKQEKKLDKKGKKTNKPEPVTVKPEKPIFVPKPFTDTTEEIKIKHANIRLASTGISAPKQISTPAENESTAIADSEKGDDTES